MPALSFSIGKDKIKSGAKRQTIRGDRKFPIKNGHDSTIRDDFGLPSFAVNAGFNNWQELVKFFENTHGLPFPGNLIEWDEIV
jgi:hypothetical protein